MCGKNMWRVIGVNVSLMSAVYKSSMIYGIDHILQNDGFVSNNYYDFVSNNYYDFGKKAKNSLYTKSLYNKTVHVVSPIHIQLLLEVV